MLEWNKTYCENWRNRLGKNSNRVIGRYQLKPAKADGRPGWSVERL